LDQGRIPTSARNTTSLFVASLVPYTIGNMLLITLQLRAARLGANETIIGLFMASTFLAVTAGSVAAGWLVNSQQKGVSLVVAGGVANGVVLALVGLAGRFEVFVLMAWLSMFLIGFGQTTINILTGQIAAASERGRVFGLIGLTFGLGLLIGGFIAGPIVDHFGFTVFFFVSGVVSLIQPLAVLNIRAPNPAAQKSEEEKAPTIGSRLQGRFYLLFLANLIAFVAQFVGVLGRQLVMDGLGFSITAISVTLAISGLCVTPMTLVVGWFSDRTNRLILLALTYVLTAFGLFIMIDAHDAFRFGLSAALITSVNAGIVIGLAHITDTFPRASLGRGISLYNSTIWLGAVIGFAFAGKTIQYLGAPVTFTIATILAVASAGLVLPLMNRKKREHAVSAVHGNHLKVQFAVRKPGFNRVPDIARNFDGEIIDVKLADCVFLSCANPGENGDNRLSIETHDTSANQNGPKYAAIRRSSDKLYLEHFGDTIMIRINGLELKPHRLYQLRKGDEIELGPLEIIVLFEEPSH
jgi:MFS family permease